MSNAREGFVVDLSGYKDRSSARLPEGDYLVRITDGEVTEIKSGNNAGQPMVNLFYEVVGGPSAGQVLVDRLPITENALWRVVAFLRAVGLKVEKKQLQIPFKLIVGRSLTVTVEDGEPYNGNIKSEIRGYAQATAAPKAETASPAQTFVTAPVTEEPAADEAAIDSFEPEATLRLVENESNEIQVPATITL